MMKMIKKLLDFLSLAKMVIGLFPQIGIALSALIGVIIAFVWSKNNTVIVVVIVEALVVLAIVFIYYYNYTLRAKFIAVEKQRLIERGILIEGIEYATSRRSITAQKKVFWPVVPNKERNIIHIAHVNTLKLMLKNGFDVYVLVYDMYYKNRRRHEYNETNKKSLDKEVEIFIDNLKKIGLKSSLLCKVRYKYESKSAKAKFHEYYSAISGAINLDQLQSISNKKLSQKKMYTLRVLKPLSIMAFLISAENKLFRTRIAATLSGVDEKVLYDKCHKIMKDILPDGYVPFHIYIPQFNGFGIQGVANDIPGVMDAQCSLSEDNKAKIKAWAAEYSCNLKKPDDPFLFLINHVLFPSDAITFTPQCTEENISMNRLQFIQRCGEKGCSRIGSCVIEGIYRNLAN